MTRDQLLSRGQAEAALRRMGAPRDGTSDLLEAALLFAAFDRPPVSLAPYRAHLGRLADDAAARLRGEDDHRLAPRLDALGDAMFSRHGYGACVDGGDLGNADLMTVIDRRRGLPLALGILFISAARALGLTAAGVDFPGRFLVRVDSAGERALIDPSRRGRRCGAAELRDLVKAALGENAEIAPAHYRVMDDCAVLLRLRHTVKFQLVHDGAFERALRVLDSMLLIAPATPDLWHEDGILKCRLGRTAEAIDALERFLSLSPVSHPERNRAAALVLELKASSI